MNSTEKRSFLQKVKILNNLKVKERNMTHLQKVEGGFTRAHLQKIIDRFEEGGIVKTTKYGRERIVSITPRGVELVDSLNKIVPFTSCFFF